MYKDDLIRNYLLSGALKESVVAIIGENNPCKQVIKLAEKKPKKNSFPLVVWKYFGSIRSLTQQVPLSKVRDRETTTF